MNAIFERENPKQGKILKYKFERRQLLIIRGKIYVNELIIYLFISILTWYSGIILIKDVWNEY